MRHRQDPHEDGDEEHALVLSRKDLAHHDRTSHLNTSFHRSKSDTRHEVVNLKRVIRLQNQVIIGLSSCFALLILSTMILVHNLPHQDHDDQPFWENDHMQQQPPQPLQDGNKLTIIDHHKQGKELAPQIATCTKYGCPIYPIEMLHLHNTSHSLIASHNQYLLITHKSNRKKPAPINQDRAIYIPAFGMDYKSQDESDNFFLGLYDGHDDNGHKTAQYASEQIPSRIASRIGKDEEESGNKNMIRQDVMTHFIKQTYIDVDETVPDGGGGCTGISILRNGDTLYMANTGDSTTFIGVYHPPISQLDEQKSQANENYMSNAKRDGSQLHLQGTVSIHHENKKHKAHFEEEHARIEALGGRIHIPPKNPMNSRVIVRSTLHREDVGLAMSRSIGDWEWTAIGVIPDPDVTIVDLNQFWKEHDIQSKSAKVFVVAGSDGLFDTRRVEFVANHLAFGLFESKIATTDSKLTTTNQLDDHLIDVGRKMITMSSPLKEEWYRDDITFAVKVIDL